MKLRSKRKLHSRSNLSALNFIEDISSYPINTFDENMNDATMIITRLSDDTFSNLNTFLTSSAESSESWRQYVPLVVSCLVIIDILLGSPAANLVMAPLKKAKENQGEDNDEGSDSPRFGFGGINKNTSDTKKRERIDSDLVVMEALEKARNSRELRDYLEATKTDVDRMQDMRKKIDKQIAELEENS